MSAAPTSTDWIAVDWIAVDWGTSNLRAWAMDAGGRPVAEASSAAGMATLERADFEPALIALVADWLAPDRVTQAIVCGMAGSREGWVEAPYASVPAAPSLDAARVPMRDPRLAVHILPGLSQSRPADVMRGEETQIAGLIAREPCFDGVACLPGTHSKWAHVSAGEIVSFTTAMTGELFALLSERSVLRHSVAAEGWSAEDFAQAVEDTLARPERLASALFAIRAEALLAGLAPARARARLSGLLIGAELAATRAHWLGRAVVLIGSEGLSQAYAEALALCGVTARRLDATAMTLAGLAAARDALAAEGAHP